MGNFESMHTSWNTVILKFRWIFATDERKIVKGQTFHMVSCGSPLIRVSFVATDQWASPKLMEALSRHNSLLIGRKNQAKFETDCISSRAVVFRLFQKTVILPPKPVGFRLTYTQLWDIFFIRFVSICLN